MKLVFVLILYVLLSNKFVSIYKLPEGLTIDPYNKTPLSAIYNLDTVNTDSLTVHVKGRSNSLSIAHTYPKAYGKTFPIHGFYANATNKLTITLGEKILLSTNIVIGDVYEDDKKRFPEVDNPSILVHVNKNKFDPYNQDLYFLYDNYTNIAAYDGAGELRYLYRNTLKMLSRIENQSNQLYFYFVDKKILKVNFLGQQEVKSLLPAHHEFVYKKVSNNNHKIVLTVSPRGGVEDRVTQIDANGKIIRDLLIGDVFRNVLSPKDQQVLKQTVYDKKNLISNHITKKERLIDWAHANSLVFDENNDILYLSLRHLGVVAVSYTEWKLLWWMAHDKLKIIKGQSYGEVPPEFVYLPMIKELRSFRMTAKTYPRAQHGLLLRSNGNVILFDNNGDKVHNFQGSRVLEYKFNHQTKKATLIRQYRHPRRVYSRVLSDVDLVGENWLILWGFDTPTTGFRITRLAEVNPKNQLIVDMSLRRDWVYRVEKKPLYPYQQKDKRYSIDVLERDNL